MQGIKTLGLPVLCILGIPGGIYRAEDSGDT